MLTVAEGWDIHVDRGPDWLIVRLSCRDPQSPPFDNLAEHIWDLLQQHFVSRVVLEMDEVCFLPSYLIGQLVLLHKRLHTNNGVMRLCGLSDANQQAIRTCRLEGRFPHYRNREEAVRGYRPQQPR